MTSSLPRALLQVLWGSRGTLASITTSADGPSIENNANRNAQRNKMSTNKSKYLDTNLQPSSTAHILSKRKHKAFELACSKLCYKYHVNNLPLTLIEGTPACHQTWTASRGLHARGETHRSDTVGQDHWGSQLHQGYIIVKSLWVELQEVERKFKWLKD